MFKQCKDFHKELLSYVEEETKKKMNADLPHVCMSITESFLDFYSSSLEISILSKMSNKNSFEECEKIGLNCLCLSINIFNLMMETVTDKQIGKLFDYLNGFSQHFESSPIARRMTETILYCLCNYCNETLDQIGKLMILTDDNVDDLRKCFEQSRSVKMKLAAAIVSCFLASESESVVIMSKGYVSDVYNNCFNNNLDEYLGIQKQLVQRAIIGVDLVTYNKHAEKIKRRKFEMDTKKREMEDLTWKLRRNEELERLERKVRDYFTDETGYLLDELFNIQIQMQNLRRDKERSQEMSDEGKRLIKELEDENDKHAKLMREKLDIIHLYNFEFYNLSYESKKIKEQIKDLRRMNTEAKQVTADKGESLFTVQMKYQDTKVKHKPIGESSALEDKPKQNVFKPFKLCRPS